MHVVLIRYLKPNAEVDRVRPAHRAFLDQLYEKNILIASGPQVPRTGGILLARGISKVELEKLLKEDPFQKEGVGEYQVVEFEVAKHAKGMEPYV